MIKDVEQARKTVYGLLEDKINEIFFKMQEENGIKYGDIFPLDQFRLNELTEEMSSLITNVLCYES